MNIDFIGDIHGDSYKLKALLDKLGYQREIVSGESVYVHPDGRKAQFVGDYIDKGPNSKEVLDIVISMVKHTGAVAMLGNHEYNYLAYWTKHRKSGKWLRPHNEDNDLQNKATRDSIGDDPYYLEFMNKLLIYERNPFFYAIHAHWDENSISLIRKENLLELGLDFLERSSDPDHHYFAAIEQIIKGPEIALEKEDWFYDSTNKLRKKKRIEWWDAEMMIELFDDPDKISVLNRPIFFGHYSIKDVPHLIDKDICCLDFGDFKKEKYLTAYRWNGEMSLTDNNLIWV